MALVPISATLQKSYRDTLLIPDAPAFIETQLAIQPVAVVSQAGSNLVQINDATNSRTAQLDAGSALPTTRVPVGATRVIKCMHQTTVADTLYSIHTVTALKTLYITDIFVSSSGNGVFVRVGPDISGVTITSGTIYTDCFIGVSGTSTQYNWPVHFDTPMTAVAGAVIKFEANGASSISVTIIGYEI